MEKKKIVIFDFDGVFVNSLPFCFALNKKTNPDLTFEEYSKMFHGNFWDALFGGIENKTFAKNPIFFEEYEEGIYDFQTLSGVSKAIQSLSDQHILTIVSSGSEPIIRKFLEKENLFDHFSGIYGKQTHTSKVVKLKNLLDEHNISPLDAVFVTDTLGDVLEANEVGIRSIGDTWGLHDHSTLSLGNPEIIIDDHELLEETIRKVLSQ